MDLRVTTPPSSSQGLPLNLGRGTLGIVQLVEEPLESFFVLRQGDFKGSSIVSKMVRASPESSKPSSTRNPWNHITGLG